LSGIEHTVRKVSDEALDEMDKSIDESKSAALDVVARKSGEAEAEVARISDRQRRQAEALKRQIIGSAEMTSRNRTLEIVEENLNSAFSQALERLSGMTGEVGYNRVLKSLILEGIDEVGGSDFAISGNSKDQQLLELVADGISQEGNVKIAVSNTANQNSVGGVVVSSADGFVTFDNTYEARLERLKPELRKQIAQLFTAQT
jgi:V/A-type H+/Na+-transporting ATPase subunit E